MEIVNTPVDTNFSNGANFASNRVSVNRETESQQIKSDDKSNSESIESRKPNVGSVNEQNNTQANAQAADTVDREVQGQSLELAVKEVESFLQVQNRNLSFSIDDKTERAVVTVKDSSSGDVIRQIPSEEVLQLADRIKSLQEDIGSSVGVFINNKV